MRVGALIAMTPTPRRAAPRGRLKLGGDFAEFFILGQCGALVGAQEPHRQTRTGKRLLLDETYRQAEGAADLAHLVFIELDERLDDLTGLDASQQLRHPIVMRFDKR